MRFCSISLVVHCHLPWPSPWFSISATNNSGSHDSSATFDAPYLNQISTYPFYIITVFVCLSFKLILRYCFISLRNEEDKIIYLTLFSLNFASTNFVMFSLSREHSRNMQGTRRLKLGKQPYEHARADWLKIVFLAPN